MAADDTLERYADYIEALARELKRHREQRRRLEGKLLEALHERRQEIERGSAEPSPEPLMQWGSAMPRRRQGAWRFSGSRD